MQANQSQQIKLWPLCVHTKINNTMNIQKTDTLKNRTWVKIPRVMKKAYLNSLGCNCSFSVSSVLHSQKSSESSFACHLLFQTILLCTLSRLSKCLFLFSLYSYQPLKLNLLKRIHFPFFYFPFFFSKITFCRNMKASVTISFS